MDLTVKKKLLVRYDKSGRRFLRSYKIRGNFVNG